jgi:enoyl-CoA hydratase
MTVGKWLETRKSILFEVANGVARLTLNAPEKRNAMSPKMLEEIRLALLEADDLLSVNVILRNVMCHSAMAASASGTQRDLRY